MIFINLNVDSFVSPSVVTVFMTILFDFRTNAKLAKFLRGHRDENFLKPHGGPVER